MPEVPFRKSLKRGSGQTPLGARLSRKILLFWKGRLFAFILSGKLLDYDSNIITR